MRIGLATGLIVLGFAVSASAQVQAPSPESIGVGDWLLRPVVEAKLRGEYRHDLDGADRAAVVERARLGVEVDRGPLAARVVLEDARVWDLASGVDPVWEAGAQAVTGAYELWVEGHTSSARPAFLRVGRQAITWGEGRLLGVADWSPRGRTFDAARARWPVGDGAFELLAVTLADPSGAAFAAGGSLFGARGEWAYHPLFAVEGYALARQAPSSTADDEVRGQTYTGAVRLHGDGSGWTWGVEGAYQLGHADDVAPAGEARSAWAAAGHVAYRFDRVLWAPVVRLAGSYASGDDGGSMYRGFDPLFPEVHTWHGAMDVFGWSNEGEGSARVSVEPWPDASALLEYRYARLAQPGGAWRSDYLQTIGRVSANSQADLGHEVDAALVWSPWVSLELTAGYSLLALGDGAKAILRGTDASFAPPAVSQFGYVEGTVRMP